MKEILIPTSESSISSNTALLAARGRHGKFISREKMSLIFADIERSAQTGALAEAEKIILETIETFALPVETRARLAVLLSETLDKQGRFDDSLTILKSFEKGEPLGKLKPRVLIAVLTQMARAYANGGDFARSLELLNAALETAESESLEDSPATIYLEFARVCRLTNELSASYDYAEKALKTARRFGDREAMAESHLALGAIYLRKGAAQKALEFSEQSLKIADQDAAPALIGEIYVQMAQAFAALDRPGEAINLLENAVSVFERYGLRHRLASALNQLGVNQTLVGKWGEAEETLRRALEIAFENGDQLFAEIFDSLGTLKLLQGRGAEAEKLLTQAFNSAAERKNEPVAARALKNLARVRLSRGEIEEALKNIEEASIRAEGAADEKLMIAAQLVKAECFLHNANRAGADEILDSVEETVLEDLPALGEIQRLRGLQALSEGFDAQAFEHFTRSLSIFETTQDLYNMALLNYEIGRTIARTEPGKAIKHLTSATETFRLLGAEDHAARGETELKAIQKADFIETKRETSVGSQLLMLRLAEAVASRELLFRELVTVLQQESRATKIVLAEPNAEGKFYPFIIQGFTPAESMTLVEKTEKAIENNDLENFAEEKYLNVFRLSPPSAPPAILILYPAAGGNLADGTSIKPLLRVVELGMDVCALREKDRSQNPETQADESPFISNSLLPGFIHSSPAMTALVEEVYRIRSSDVTVLITGESGTGKELVARAIHTLSRRKDKVFIPFNCTAVPRELAESYFFGAKKGSYTGAFNDTPGMIRTADGGTLFLDEIGDLPLEVQPKLLRFLQEGEIHPVGERKPISVDVRIIAATNKPLEDKVESGAFREDLYYRLNVIRLHVPPLRERRSEIPLIANYYLNYYSAKFARRDLIITPQAMDLLTVFDWHGNVRQLSNEVQRLVARAENGEKITPKQLSPELQSSTNVVSQGVKGNVKSPGSIADTFKIEDGSTLEDAVSELEKRMINDSMKRHGGNITRVARELGLTRRGLYLKIERYRLSKTA